MEYNIYIGAGIKESDLFLKEVGNIGADFLDSVAALKPSSFYPLYNNPKLFPLYKTTKIPEDSIPLVVVGHNSKADYQITTNLSVLLVPVSSGAEDSCCLKSEQYGFPEFYLYKKTGITFQLKKRGSFYYALSQLKVALSQNKAELGQFYKTNGLSFDMMPVHNFVRKPCSVSNVDSKIVVNDGSWNVIAKAQITDEFSIVSSTENYKNLGTLPNYFFEDHMVFGYFDEINVGVENESNPFT